MSDLIELTELPEDEIELEEEIEEEIEGLCADEDCTTNDGGRGFVDGSQNSLLCGFHAQRSRLKAQMFNIGALREQAMAKEPSEHQVHQAAIQAQKDASHKAIVEARRARLAEAEAGE